MKYHLKRLFILFVILILTLANFSACGSTVKTTEIKLPIYDELIIDLKDKVINFDQFIIYPSTNVNYTQLSGEQNKLSFVFFEPGNYTISYYDSSLNIEVIEAKTANEDSAQNIFIELNHGFRTVDKIIFSSCFLIFLCTIILFLYIRKEKKRRS